MSVIEDTVRQAIKEKEAANAAKVEAEELAHQYKRQYEELQTKLMEAPDQGVRDFFAKVNQDGYSLARLYRSNTTSAIVSFCSTFMSIPSPIHRLVFV